MSAAVITTAVLIVRAEALGREWRGPGHRPVWLVASTHRGEDDIVLDAFARVLGILSGRLGAPEVLDLLTIDAIRERPPCDLLALTGAALELLTGALRPALRGGGGQVLLEVVGGTGFVAAEDHHDGLRRKGLTGIQRCDLRIVPTLDGAVEDLALLYDSRFRLIGLSWDESLLLLMLGTFLGCVAAKVSAQRHLKEIEPV